MLYRSSRVAVFLLFLAVNLLLTVHNWLPGPWMPRIFVPVVEAVLLVALIVTSVRLTGKRALVATIASIAMLAAGLIFPSAEALFQYIWGRPFLFRTDVPMIRGGLLLILGDIGPVVERLVPVAIAAIAAMAIVVAAALVGVARRTLRVPGHDSRPPVPAVVVLAALVVAVAFPFFGGPGGGSVSPLVVRSLTHSGRLELREIGQEGARSAGVPGSGVAGRSFSADAQGDSPSDGGDGGGDGGEARDDQYPHRHEVNRYRFPGLLDRDMYFFMIEAYGYAVFSRDELRDELAPYLDRLEQVLRSAGYGIRSSYVEAPVFGGFSWLSEATVLTGQNVNSQPKFEELIHIARERELPSLARMLHEGGYYTLMVKPGTVHGSWPEGWDLFRFERSLVAHDGDFNYRGPWFSYVAITDQHALWTADRYLRGVRGPDGPAEDRPVYIHYQLVSSHTPFNRIPPYLENWEDLGDGTVYHERSQEILTFNNTWGGGTELDEGYTASIAYVLTVLASYLEQFMDHQANPILIFMGDHQPQRPIREQEAGPSVPVHIASRDRVILDALEAEGYDQGFYSLQLPPHGAMMDFYPMIARIAAGGGQRNRGNPDRIDGGQIDN
jgi:hypothetical protein